MNTKQLTYFAPEQFIDQPIKVVVVGAGGTGSEVVDGLTRIDMALRSLTNGKQQLDVAVFDPDHVSESNLVRQRYTQIDLLGNKAIQLTNRMNLIHGLDWCGYPKKYSCERTDLTYNHGIIITCTDSAAFRSELGQTYQDKETDWLWLDYGNSLYTAQVILGHLGLTSGLRLPNVFDLYPELTQSDHYDKDDIPSCSVADALKKQDLFINRTVADIGLGLLWKLLSKGKLTQHGAFIDLTENNVSPLVISPQAWSFMGYENSKDTLSRDEILGIVNRYGTKLTARDIAYYANIDPDPSDLEQIMRDCISLVHSKQLTMPTNKEHEGCNIYFQAQTTQSEQAAA